MSHLAGCLLFGIYVHYYLYVFRLPFDDIYWAGGFLLAGQGSSIAPLPRARSGVFRVPRPIAEYHRAHFPSEI
jgi:hypothetical protein